MADRPRTLYDEIAEGNVLVPYKRKNKHSPLVYPCECGQWVRPGRLVDCRYLLLIEQDWACDGCLSRIERTAADRRAHKAAMRAAFAADLRETR